MTVPRTENRVTSHLPRRAAIAVLVICGVLPVAACAGATEPVIIDGDGASWSIGVTDPRFAGDERCLEDTAIQNAVSTTDLPSSGLGITLTPDGTEEDALRIAECLQKALSSGEITISRPTPP